MNDINIAVLDGASGRSSLLQLVKGCPEDSSGVSHAMVPIAFTPAGGVAPDVTVVNRAIFKRDLSTNKQGVASMVMQVKIPYVKMSSASAASGSGTQSTRQATVTKDYISCHIVLALPRVMMTDWRDSAHQRDAEVQLETALLILNAWARQYGLVIDQIAESAEVAGKTRQTYQRMRVDEERPSSVPDRDPTITVDGEPGGRATAFTLLQDATLRDPLTDPLMSAFGGVCAEVHTSAVFDNAGL